MKDDKLSPARGPDGAPLPCQTGPPRRILVVDDEPDIRRLNAEVLKSSGYVVDTAEDGKAGWHALRAASHAPDSYDLLITDHNMPELSGLALVKKLRAARMDLPVIMASGTLPQEDLFARYPWLQPAVVLIKPYGVEDLLGTVEQVLRGTVSPGEQIAPPPDWRSRPSAGGLRL